MRVADGPPLSLDKQLHRILQPLVLPQIYLLDSRFDRFRFRLLLEKALVGLQNKEPPGLLDFHFHTLAIHRQHVSGLVRAFDNINPFHTSSFSGNVQPDNDRVLGMGQNSG